MPLYPERSNRTVIVIVEEVMVPPDHPHGRDQEGVEVTCKKCKHSVQIFGRSDASIRRGCATLREECPNMERNFYTDK